MDDADLSALDLLRQHGVHEVREVHTYVGQIDGVGDVRFKVLDGGAVGPRRWSVEAYDSIDTQLASHDADRLAVAIGGVFQALKSRFG